MKKTCFLLATLLFVTVLTPAWPTNRPCGIPLQSAKAICAAAYTQPSSMPQPTGMEAAQAPTPPLAAPLFSGAMAQSVTPEPSPTAVSDSDNALSKASAVTLAKAVLLETFGYTQAQADALQYNATFWAGENMPVCYLVDFYRGARTAANRVISIAINAESGNLYGCELLLDTGWAWGGWAWVAADGLTEDVLQRACVPTPDPTGNRIIPIEPTPTPVRSSAPAATPDPDAVARMKVFVEQVFVPYVLADSASLTFTQAQRQELLTLAEDAGLPFTRDWQNTLLAGSEPRAKNDVLADLVGSQLHYEGSWPVEDMYWYGEMRVRCGFWTDNPNLLPIPGELTQAEALAYARQCLLAQTDVDEAWLQTCDIRWSFQRNVPDANDASAVLGDRVWWITFYPDDPLASASYLVKFSAMGGNACIITK